MSKRVRLSRSDAPWEDECGVILDAGALEEGGERVVDRFAVYSLPSSV